MSDYERFKIGDLVIVKHLANTSSPYGIITGIEPEPDYPRHTLYWVNLVDCEFRSPHHSHELILAYGDNKNEDRLNKLPSLQNNSGDYKKKDGKQ